jgi:hypothetical protein
VKLKFPHAYSKIQLALGWGRSQWKTCLPFQSSQEQSHRNGRALASAVWPIMWQGHLAHLIGSSGIKNTTSLVSPAEVHRVAKHYTVLCKLVVQVQSWFEKIYSIVAMNQSNFNLQSTVQGDRRSLQIERKPLIILLRLQHDLVVVPATTCSSPVFQEGGVYK